MILYATPAMRKVSLTSAEGLTRAEKLTSAEEFVPFAMPDIGEAEIGAAAEAMRSGWLATGARTADFEREFAEFLGGSVQLSRSIRLPLGCIWLWKRLASDLGTRSSCPRGRSRRPPKSFAI